MEVTKDGRKSILTLFDVAVAWQPMMVGIRDHQQEKRAPLTNLAQYVTLSIRSPARTYGILDSWQREQQLAATG